MPGAATPWPMDAKFRGPAGGSLRQVYSNYGAVQAQRQPQQHAVARRGGKAVQHSKDSLDQAVMPPFTEEVRSFYGASFALPIEGCQTYFPHLLP